MCDDLQRRKRRPIRAGRPASLARVIIANLKRVQAVRRNRNPPLTQSLRPADHVGRLTRKDKTPGIVSENRVPANRLTGGFAYLNEKEIAFGITHGLSEFSGAVDLGGLRRSTSTTTQERDTMNHIEQAAHRAGRKA